MYEEENKFFVSMSTLAVILVAILCVAGNSCERLADERFKHCLDRGYTPIQCRGHE